MGNENSSTSGSKLGNPLENDMKLNWVKSPSVCPTASREGHCAAVVPLPLAGDAERSRAIAFIFGGVTRSENGENREFNDLLTYCPGM
jgi:hypothetical protein